MADTEKEIVVAHVYDAIKRREYYLRNRQLAGRKTGAAKTSKPRPKAKSKIPKESAAQRQARRRQKLQAEVDYLKSRLKKLRVALAEMVKKAQARSGKTSSKKAPAKKSADRKQTATQKAKAAKQSKKYYNQNKEKILADEVKSLVGKIKTMQERIAKMRKNGSVGARRTAAK